MQRFAPIEVVEAARAGDPDAIECLLETVWTHAYRIARGVVQNSSAEDCAQEASVIVYRVITRLRNAAAFQTWFYRVVLRTALKYQRQSPTFEPLDERTAAPADASDPADLWRALSSLSPKLRATVILHYFEDLGSREIAHVLQIPDATVRFRLMTARRQLRRLLDDTTEATTTKGEASYAL